jgi:outer membrane biosynthesis protein TonB
LPQPPLVPLPPRPRPSWSSLAASAVLHVAVIVLAVVLSTRQPTADEGDPERRSEPTRQVEMVYLPPLEPEPAPPPPEPPPQAEPEPPPPRPRPTTPPRPSAPPPKVQQPEPEDRANAPPDALRSEGEETDEPEGASDPAAPPAADRAEAAAAEAPTLESEARRIFGRRRVATRPGAGPRAVRPLETYIPDRPDKCVPSPRPASDSSTPVQYGTVVGRIFRQDGGKPLAGAHLQMLGTPYVAFTDNQGEYRFRFELSLMDNCRTQYVRVTARGYESRLLVLTVGQSVRSEDVHLQRRSRWPGL